MEQIHTITLNLMMWHEPASSLSSPKVIFVALLSRHYVNETVAAYCKLPENVRISLVKTGTPTYIINHDDIPKLTTDMNLSYNKRGRTITYRYSSGLRTAFMVLIADSAQHTTQESVIFHEAGHYINHFCLHGDNPNVVTSSLSDSQEFVALADKYLTTFKNLASETTGSIMDDTNTKASRSEMYAEAFTLYLMYPDKLLKAAPELYNYISETFGTI